MRGLSDCSVSCLGSADWSPVVRSGGGNVQLRALALCVQEPQELAFFASNTSRVICTSASARAWMLGTCDGGESVYAQVSVTHNIVIADGVITLRATASQSTQRVTVLANYYMCCIQLAI